MRTIQSPGVEISEVDLSLRPSLPIGTNILVPGFSSKGPTEEVIEITTLSEFEQVYGAPTNAAERYFYHTVKAIKSSPANVFVYRLPYGGGDDLGDTSNMYSVLVYPVIAANADASAGGNDSHSSFYANRASTDGLSAYNDTIDTEASTPRVWKDGVVYYIGEPQNYNITAEQYDNFKQGNMEWSSTPFTDTLDYSPFTSFEQAIQSGAGIVVANSRKNIINEKFEGFYVGMIDNTNLNPATDYDGCLGVYSINSKLSGSNPALDSETGAPPDGNTGEVQDSYLRLPATRLNFALSGTDRPSNLALGDTGSTGSVSEVLENLSDKDLGTAEFDDTIAIGLFKIRQSVLEADTTKLDYILSESYVGSLNGFKKASNQQGGGSVSDFIEDVAETKAGTPNVQIFVNPYLSQEQGDWFDHELGVSKKKIRVHTSKSADSEGIYLDDVEKEATEGFRTDISTDPAGGPSTWRVRSANNLYPCGVFKDTSLRTVEVGAIPSKLERMFEVLDNYELYPLDITCEAGLGTIYVGTSGGRTSGFNDEAAWHIDGSELPAGNTGDDLYQTKIVSDFKAGDEGGTVMNYRFVNDAFVNFASTRRKDLLHIADNLRYIFVQGKNSKVLDQEYEDTNAMGETVKTKKFFSKHVYWPLRHIHGNTNSSYACAFGNWVKVFDGTLNRGIWSPFSGFAAALMGNTDANFQPWYAPAGFTRGILTGVSDLAIYPKLKERDQLYKIGQNPIANFPNDGFVVFGQKTLQKKPSAFDRINVRRLFLYLEKAVRATVKYFIFEPNTLFTRTQVVNVLTPIFENAKNTEGMYDYLIVCDERNNTPDVIDQNEMVIDIYIKPVRAAEFILVNFFATRTGQDFNELVG